MVMPYTEDEQDIEDKRLTPIVDAIEEYFDTKQPLRLTNVVGAAAHSKHDDYIIVLTAIRVPASKTKLAVEYVATQGDYLGATFLIDE